MQNCVIYQFLMKTIMQPILRHFRPQTKR